MPHLSTRLALTIRDLADGGSLDLGSWVGLALLAATVALAASFAVRS